MAASAVPVIYDHASKKVLRWAVLDFERQLSDRAFGAQNPSERVLRIPTQIYKMFGQSGSGFPALNDIQSYVNGNAP